MSSYRNDQLADVVRNVVGRFSVEVPPNVASLVSVSRVELSQDCAYADVYIGAIGESKKAVEYLQKHRMKDIGKTLQKEFKAHTIPKIRLHPDDSGKETHKLETLIDSL